MRLFTYTLAGGPIAAVLVSSYDGRTDEQREIDFKAARKFYAGKVQDWRNANK